MAHHRACGVVHRTLRRLGGIPGNERGYSIMGILGNLIKYIFRAFFRILFSALLFAIIGAGVSLLISFLVTKEWPPTALTIVACVVIGLLFAYAAGMTVLVGTAIGAVRDAEQDVAKEVREIEGKR